MSQVDCLKPQEPEDPTPIPTPASPYLSRNVTHPSLRVGRAPGWGPPAPASDLGVNIREAWNPGLGLAPSPLRDSGEGVDACALEPTTMMSMLHSASGSMAGAAAVGHRPGDRTGTSGGKEMAPQSLPWSPWPPARAAGPSTQLSSPHPPSTVTPTLPKPGKGLPGRKAGGECPP